MKLTEKLANAIRRGIIRIFPLPITFEQALVISTLVTTACILLGCSSSRQLTTQLVHDVRTDTIYLNSRQYDSIYIYKDHSTDRSKDTLYIKDVSIEYRYKMLRDTIKVVQHDSIPYEVTIIETKEITRPLTWFDKTCRACFFFLFGFIIFWLFKKIGIIKPLYF